MYAPSGLKYLLVCSALAALLSYNCYKPLPDNIEEPWKTRWILTFINSITVLGRFGESLGLGTFANIARLVMSIASKLQDYPHGLKMQDLEFDGVRVRVYQPVSEKQSQVGVVFYHGGGWIVGSVDTHDHCTQMMAREVPAVVVSVEYRLAPEFPYPAPLEDCLQATIYFIKHAAEFGVDPRRIAISGDSAGGNLAAAIALKLRGNYSLHQPKLQLLIYPSLQAFDFMLPSYVKNDGVAVGTVPDIALAIVMYMGLEDHYVQHFINNSHTSVQMKREFRRLVDPDLLPIEMKPDLTTTAADDFGNQKLSEEIGKFILDPLFMPLMANHLSGLPEAYILTVEHDILRDDGILYAKRLEKAGVKVTWVHYPDGIHGIWSYIKEPLRTRIGLRSMANLIQFLKKKL